MNDQDRIKLAEAMGWTPWMHDYEYVWAVNQRKGCGQADYYFTPDDDPAYQNWEVIDDDFWRDDHTDNYHFRRKLPEPTQQGWLSPSGTVRALPDPFTDANDDYAVLEWMRAVTEIPADNFTPEDWQRWLEFQAALSSDTNSKSGLKGDYQIGDYARAALKVLE